MWCLAWLRRAIAVGQVRLFFQRARWTRWPTQAHLTCPPYPMPGPLPRACAVELLRSAKWQERVEAMGSVLSVVQGMDDPGPRCYELVQCVAFLPGFGDKNFQVSRWAWLRCMGLGRARQHVGLPFAASPPRNASLTPPLHVCGT